METQLIEDFFREHSGIVETRQLREAGFTHYQLNHLMDSGRVVKLKQGLYKWNEADRDEMSDVARIVPAGVFCLFTACQYYELSTFISSEYHLAIPKKSKVVLPEYPPIKLYYWEQTSYSTGITQINKDGIAIQMYDIEKTVCDMVRQRNKIGTDTVKEVVQHYLQRKDRNLATLTRYAKELSIGQYVSDYISILL
jgi:predicted transcriptional regulator of viral defense system